MAKRFTDTKLPRRAWYRKLQPRLKCAWEFLYRECDGAGVWSIDEEALEFHIGERVTVDELLLRLNDGEVRVARVQSDKLLLVGFIPFQYGTLSPDCKPHQPVIHRLKELNLWEGYGKGFQTLKDKEEDKEKEKEKEKKGGVGEKTAGQLPGPSPILTQVSDEDKRVCFDEWLKTLRHWGVRRTNLLEDEQIEIVRAIIRKKSARAVQCALAGKRAEVKSDGYNPADYLNLDRIFHKDREGRERFQDYLNAGIKLLSKEAEAS